MQYKLSVLIPARQEEWLARTVQDIIEHKNDETEIIIGCDGNWPEPGIPDHEDVTIVYYPESIGQRAMQNQLCKISKAKYVMKLDAHCTVDQDFDKKMIEAFEKSGDNVVIVPIMRNLHVFDLVCPDGHRRYQSPDGPCKECGKETHKEIMWIPKTSPQSKSYSFDSSPHFQYFNDYCKRPSFKKDLEETSLTESMSIQGSCFMMSRDKYWELDICDESFGSWGSQGVEIASKMWCSGGKVLINHNTFYSHCFRTQGSTFGFPYPQSGKQVNHAKQYAKKIFFEERWPKAIRPVSWLVERFWPVTYWKDEDLANLKEMEKKVWPTKGMIYFTDNQLKLSIAHTVQNQLLKISKEKNIPIVSASLKPMEKMGKNIHLKLERGVLTMFKQILAALEASTADVVYFTEHDCLYNLTTFDFVPPRKDTFYYNLNVIKVDVETGKTLKVDVCKQVSGICVYRETAVKHYRERVKYIEENGYNRNMGYEPGTHGRIKWENDYKSGDWISEIPMLDLRHSNNLTPNRWKQEQFRDKRNCKGWTEGDIKDIEGCDINGLSGIIKK